MKRKQNNKNIEGEELIWWKNHGGIHRMPNKIIKPNQKFQAYPSQIPQGFRDKIRPLPEEETRLQKQTEKKEKEKKEVNKVTYEITHRGGAYYDVLNSSTKKAVNEKALKEDEAKEMLKSLTDK